MGYLKRIPPKITEKLKNITGNSVIVAYGLRVSLSDIAKEKFKSVNIEYKSDKLIIPSTSVFPQANAGKVSEHNINGYEIIHKDWPKIDKEIFLGDRPVYGDWEKGSFSLWQTRLVYQRTFVPPRGCSIKIPKYNFLKESNQLEITFVVEPSLKVGDKNFESDLLFELSLLKENIGYCDVFIDTTTPDEIFKTRKLSWALFPPGTREFKSEVERKILSKSPDIQKSILSRVEFIESLNPDTYIVGSGFNSNYYGALFYNDFVVFDNIDYGNATYILYEDWEQLSKLSRSELMKSSSKYIRLVHDEVWKNRLQEIVTHERQKRKPRKSRRMF